MKSYSNLTMRISMLSACLFLFGGLSVSSFAHAHQNHDQASNPTRPRPPVPTTEVCGIDVPLDNITPTPTGSRLDYFLRATCVATQLRHEAKDIAVTTCSTQVGYVAVTQYLQNPLQTTAHIFLTSNAEKFPLYPPVTTKCSEFR